MFDAAQALRLKQHLRELRVTIQIGDGIKVRVLKTGAYQALMERAVDYFHVLIKLPEIFEFPIRRAAFF